MSEPFIAEIRIFAGNFAPRSWAFCDGQLLPVSNNTALFSLIGTIYGGMDEAQPHCLIWKAGRQCIPAADPD